MRKILREGERSGPRNFGEFLAGFYAENQQVGDAEKSSPQGVKIGIILRLIAQKKSGSSLLTGRGKFLVLLALCASFLGVLLWWVVLQPAPTLVNPTGQRGTANSAGRRMPFFCVLISEGYIWGVVLR